MYNEENKAIWNKKGAVFSDKSARKEFGITQDEIYEGINSGKLQFRENNIYGNSYFKLLRSEVEKFVEEKYGTKQLNLKQDKYKLSQINKEMKILKTKINFLEREKAELLAKMK